MLIAASGNAMIAWLCVCKVALARVSVRALAPLGFCARDELLSRLQSGPLRAQLFACFRHSDDFRR